MVIVDLVIPLQRLASLVLCVGQIRVAGQGIGDLQPRAGSQIQRILPEGTLGVGNGLAYAARRGEER